jgi:predicted DNA-binding WGR domain protein
MATVTMDAMDPKSKGLAKLLKKNKVKMEILTMRGPSGWPEVELTGKREDLETVLADGEYGWDDPELAEYIEEGANVNEAKITLKRRYTENHPAVTVGKAARIRNKMLEAIADGALTEEEFNNILSEYSANAKQWMKRNARFFNVSEEGIALSKFGKKALSAVVVNEEESVTEKFVKDFDKAVLDAETEEDVLKVYPKAEFYVGKMSHFFGELEPNLFFKAYYADWYKKDTGKSIKGDFKITTIYSEKGSRYVNLYVEESAVTENYEVIYSDGVSAMKKFRNEKQALDFMKQTIASNKKLRDIAVYKPGMYSTTETDKVVMFWGNGSYLDNVSKKDPKLAAKKLEESEYIEEGRKFVAAAKKAKDAGDEEFEFNGKKFPVTIKEGNAFGAARAKAIADGKDEFTVDGETYKVKSVDKEDKENAEEFAAESFVYESFSAFVDSLNETESLNEAFKSMKLAQLLTPKKKSSWNKGIAQEFYNYTQVKLDKVEDHDLLEVDPQTAYKQKGGTKVKFFLIDNEKQSPYTEDSYDGRIQPGLIAVLNGNNDFMGAVYRRFSSEKGRILTKTDKADSLGVDKRRKGYGATGLSSAKRIADFADRAIVIDVDILRQRYSAQQQKDSRTAAKKGAIAFKTDKEFKAENIARYNEILANKAAALPLDKMVKDAIDKLADQIKEGVAKGEKGRYGDIIIGKNSKGNEAKMRDASNHMSNILDDYGRYVQYIADGEKEKAEWGKENSYYAREAKTYAKNIKDKINKIDTFDYAW